MSTEVKTSSEELQKAKGESISELAHRHLRDGSHTTSDEELRNARVEYSDMKDVETPGEEMFEEDNQTVFPAIPGEPTPGEENEDDLDKDRHVPNPYDVLGG